MNNRIIKFRVWDTIGNKWMDTFEINLIDYDYLNNPEYIIQQFTGLLDKNNKEIYEGDIVKWFHPMEDLGEVKYITKLAFNSPYPNSCYFGIDTKRLGMCHFQEDDDYEVVSNIFENPELLNNK